jgi:hypothetical protein
VSAPVVQMHRKAAKAPEQRTVTFTVPDGAFEGWEATAAADFEASVLADLQSGVIERIVKAMTEIVIDHNMPDRKGEIAKDLADVKPYDGLMAVGAGLFEALAKLPNR